jgi:beta-lactamase class D
MRVGTTGATLCLVLSLSTVRPLTGVSVAGAVPGEQPPRMGACFILHEIGKGRTRRAPSTTCDLRVTPQSTFKIPHALAALDAGVISETDLFRYDGHGVDRPLWRQDQTLATALRYSVVWYFQELARRLGIEREREYLDRFAYGNKDATGGLTTFWLGSSLTISPDEQEQFLLKLFTNNLRISERAAETVRRLLVQPPGHVTNASGSPSLGASWDSDTIVMAKTGAGPTGDGRAVRWLVGHVRREQRAWIFVSNIVGSTDVPGPAAIEQAGRALVQEGVLR